MSDEIVIFEINDGVAEVTLNKPEVHNAFDAAMIARLSEIWDALAINDDVHAVVLSGKGKSFSAGADLNWMKEAANFTKEQNFDDAMKLAAMLHKLYTLPQITIATVYGAAMGGGMGLVSCCDVVIVDMAAKFALSEVKLGLIPATIAPYVIRAIGERQAKRFFQTGERFDGKKAYEIGLAHELAERPEDVEYLVHRVLKEAAQNGTHAMRQSKKLCLDVAGTPLSEALMNDTAERIAEIRTGLEAQKRLASFLEKR
jgi:methylglutaconyl-CoA hydratase